MKLIDCFKIALNMVMHSKLRSWLTIIGIVIGIGSVLSIVSIGRGLQESVATSLDDFGANKLTIYPSTVNVFGGQGRARQPARTPTDEEMVMTQKDLKAFDLIPEIQYVDTIVSIRKTISYLNDERSINIEAVEPKTWEKITSAKMAQGRFFNPNDNFVVIIGSRIASNSFEKEIEINKMIQIEGRAFRVIGILEESGGMDSTDNRIYIPINTVYLIDDDKKIGEYDRIEVLIREDSDLDEVIEKIENRLISIRNLRENEKNFSIVSMRQMFESINEIMVGIALFLGAIAGISLLVGAVGITNTMFTSVLEKTKDIGIMKSLGAKNSDITNIFIFNAGIIGLVGGLIGLVLAYMISLALPSLMDMNDIDFISFLDNQTILLTLGGSMILGIISGLIPAKNAAKLNPVDALRYE